MRENKTCRYKKWDNLPTEELDKVLQAELEKEQPDEEVVLPILHTLEEREKDVLVYENLHTRALLEKISKRKTPTSRTPKKHLLTAGIAAAVVMIFASIIAIPRMEGAAKAFEEFYRWTESIFEFADPEQNKTDPSVETIFSTDNPGLQRLHDEVTQLGVEELVVPMWLPDGFDLSSMELSSIAGGGKIYATFENGNNVILLTYRIFGEAHAKVEKEQAGVELFEAGGICHFIVQNIDNLTVTWIVDGAECLLYTNLSKEDLYNIIRSIYRSELQS